MIKTAMGNRERPKIILPVDAAAMSPESQKVVLPFPVDFISLEFTPFCPDWISETKARQLKAGLDPNVGVIGVFGTGSVNQMLYLLSEGIVDLVYCPGLAPRDQLRITETRPNPLILSADANSVGFGGAVPRYFCFSFLPAEEVLKSLLLPYLLILSTGDESAPAVLDSDTPPFGLWLPRLTTASAKHMDKLIELLYTK